MNKSWIQATVFVVAIIGGLAVIKKIRANRGRNVMGQSEANILARKLNTQALNDAEISRITQRLSAAGWKAVGEKAVRV